MPFLFLQLFLIIDSNIISKNRFLCKHKLIYYPKNFCLISVRRDIFHPLFPPLNVCIQFTNSTLFINIIHRLIHSFCGKVPHIYWFSTFSNLLNPHNYVVFPSLSTSYSQPVDNFWVYLHINLNISTPQYLVI